MKSTFLNEMHLRGYLNQCTDLNRLDEQCQKKTITAYIGFDPTSDSLHIGSLVPIMLLAHFQKSGHQPIALVGGAKKNL